MRITRGRLSRRVPKAASGGLLARLRHPALPWLARTALAVVVLTAMGVGLISLVLHLQPLEQCTVLRTRTSPGIVTSIGSQPPGWSLSGPPAISVDVGTANQSFQLIHAFRFTGLIRPWITTNAGVRDIVQAASTGHAASRAGEQFQECAKHWALTRSRDVALAQLTTWSALLLICLALAVSGVVLFRTARFWHGFLVIGLLSLLVTAAIWGTSLLLAGAEAKRMVDGVHSLADLISYSKSRTSPAPVGPPQTGYDYVVLGDSEYSLYGGAQPTRYAGQDAQACRRSVDSLAGLLQNLTGAPALNLACPGATIANGIEGPETLHGRTMPAQLGLLEQVKDPKVVSVGIGANDNAWSIFLGVCFVTTCDAQEVRTILENRWRNQLSEFTVQDNDMLDDLSKYQKSQSSHPQIIIVGPYQPFGGSTCPQLSPGSGLVLTSGELEVLDQARAELVDVLRKGAEAHGFSYLEPKLLPLCDPVVSSLGGDIQPGTSPYRFHPTAVGELKIAIQLLQLISPDSPVSGGSPSTPATPSTPASPTSTQPTGPALSPRPLLTPQ